MNEKEKIIVERHLVSPVCRTKQGIRCHLFALSLRELGNLCFAVKADSIEELLEKLWSIVKEKKGNESLDAPKE